LLELESEKSSDNGFIIDRSIRYLDPPEFLPIVAYGKRRGFEGFSQQANGHKRGPPGSRTMLSLPLLLVFLQAVLRISSLEIYPFPRQSAPVVNGGNIGTRRAKDIKEPGADIQPQMSSIIRQRKSNAAEGWEPLVGSDLLQ